jgi:RNA polymerase sigma factor (sigma-70 family)
VRDPDEAADVLQSALALVWRDLAKIHKHPNPRAYILRLCVSAAYDALRRRQRRRRRELPLEEEALPTRPASGDPAQAALERERREALLAAIARLPPRQAQALVLRAMEEQSFDAIAQALGCSEATARSHVSKARERLREILARPTAAREVQA